MLPGGGLCNLTRHISNARHAGAIVGSVVLCWLGCDGDGPCGQGLLED